MIKRSIVFVNWLESSFFDEAFNFSWWPILPIFPFFAGDTPAILLSCILHTQNCILEIIGPSSSSHSSPFQLFPSFYC